MAGELISVLTSVFGFIGFLWLVFHVPAHGAAMRDSQALVWWLAWVMDAAVDAVFGVLKLVLARASHDLWRCG
jgi:hypothetical protein